METFLYSELTPDVAGPQAGPVRPYAQAAGATQAKIVRTMIYTCYDMCRDCRADRPEGWAFLVTSYVPMIRKLVTHYELGDETSVRRILSAIRGPELGLFRNLDPIPERNFVAELRQTVLAAFDPPEPEIAIDLDTVAAALEPLTMVEKQAAWLETMRYTPEETGAMLRVTAQTVEKVRDRAADLVRGKVDTWRRSLLPDNGRTLGRAAAAGRGSDCLSPKVFLDILDGRMTWSGREELERHVTSCWHCIDHFCRMLEVVSLLRGVQPLSDAEAESYRSLLGLGPQKRSAWKRLLGGR